MGSTARREDPEHLTRLDAEPALPEGAAFLLGADGRILAHRPCLPQPFFHGSTLVGTTVHQIGPPALGQCLGRLLLECRQRGRPCAAEIAVGADPSDPDEHRVLSLRLSPHDADPEFVAVTVRDLTRDRDRVQGLLDTIDTLRTQRDEYESAARMAAHDVRSSLSAMTGFIKLALLKPGRLSAEALEHLTHSIDVGNRLFALLDVLLETARTGPPRPERVELAPLAQRLFTALRAAHPAVAFTWCVDAGDHAAKAPPTPLWDALWNLLVNAVRYRSAERPLHVEVRAVRDGSEIRVDVQDNGRGIPAGEREHLFRRGRRGSNSGDVEGSGLGLYGTRRLVGSFGGRIWIEPCQEGALLRLAVPPWEE